MTNAPVFGVCGWKNSGKTGLMERLVAEFCRRGFTVSTIKHTHHGVDLDAPGTDSFRHRVSSYIAAGSDHGTYFLGVVDNLIYGQDHLGVRHQGWHPM